MNELQKNNLNQEVIKKSIHESEAIIKSNENLVGMGLWNIGNELRIIRDNKTYMEKGYVSFEEYTEKELNYSRRHAYNFISIAENYNVQSIAQIANLGMTKLLTLSKLEEEERETFIEENPIEDMTTRELRQAIKENKELEKQIEELRNQEPQIIEKEKIVEKEVYPADYKEMKDKLKNSIDRNNFNDLKREFEEKIDENYQLKKQVKQLSKTDSKERHREKLKDNTLIFCNRIHSFLNDVGGLAWLTDYIEELDDYDRRSYYKALDLLEGWVLTVKSNINKEEF